VVCALDSLLAVDMMIGCDEVVGRNGCDDCDDCDSCDVCEGGAVETTFLGGVGVQLSGSEESSLLSLRSSIKSAKARSSLPIRKSSAPNEISPSGIAGAEDAFNGRE